MTGNDDGTAGQEESVSFAVTGEYRAADRRASWKARWGIGRMKMRIKPGLYALGSPDPDSPVFASANYRLSFDALRTSVKGDAWLLVLDTKGINVWCAAGKGTFGTMELTRSIMESGLGDLLSRKEIIVPQLGAPGVAAHRVKAYTGFSVIYGPVRAEDIPSFMAAGKKAAPEMRRVRFGFADRMALSPIELVNFGKYLLPAAALLYFFGFRADAMLTAATLLSSTLLVPALLPWLPGRAFAIKSAAAGAIGLAAAYPFLSQDLFHACARALVYLPVASFIGLQFTGSSTYTSLSGVMKEMRAALPVQGVSLAAGLAMVLLRRFI